MRLASWNVNSLRSRIDRVEAFVQRHDVDVLAIQETKGREDQLPLMGLQALGYEVAAVGYNQWNGVALVSRVGLDDVQVGFEGQPRWKDESEARALGARCGGIRVWSVYVPNGRKPDDPHYAYKLSWFAALRAAAKGWLAEPAAIMGDWNVCPTDDDVFDVAQFKNSTHVTQGEREAFFAFAEDGWVDTTKPYTQSADQPGYTYWDYYRQRFERDRGLRIDFALGSPAFADRVIGAFVDREERDPAASGPTLGSGNPSDHAPIVLDLAD